MDPGIRLRRALVVVAAVAVTTWGAIGLYLNARLGFSGGLYTPDYMATALRTGTGLQPGDRVVSVEGFPIEKLGMESRWPRALVPRAGESRRFLVARKGEHVLVDVVYGPPSPAAMRTRFGAALIGLAFLFPAVWAFLGAESRASMKFAQIGLAVGFAGSLGLGPNLGSWNGIQDHLSTASIVLAGALLLHFFLVFPKPKRISGSRALRWAIYIPWTALLVAFVAELIVHPVLYYKIGWIPDVLMLAYVLLAIAAIIHTAVNTSRSQLQASGMYLVIAALLVTVFATVIAVAFRAPAWTYAAALLPTPVCMALAVRRTAPPASGDLVWGAEA